MSQPILTLSDRVSSPVDHSPQAPVMASGVIVLLIGAIAAWKWVQNRKPATRQVLHWIGQGKALERLQQYEAAIAVYDQALVEHPKDFRLWHERGLALAKLQRFEAAITSYDRAFELRPHYRDLAHERGDALLELGRYEDAIAAFDVFLRYAPNNGHILADRGYALYQLGHYEEALRSLNYVLKHEHQDQAALRHAHYYQIEVLRELGQFDAALRSSQAAVRRHPEAHFKTQQEHLQAQIIAAR